MEEQRSLLYQFYCFPEQGHKFNFEPAPEKAHHLKYQRKNYTELSNADKFASIDTKRLLPISLSCLSRCRRQSYVELDVDVSTPLLNGNATLKSRLSSKRRGILLSIFIVFYVGFLLLGSLTFRTCEMGEELKEQQLYRNVREGFLMKYPSVLGRNFFFIIFKSSTKKNNFFVV